jgi:linoleoyl-CoA desaturase
MLGLPSLVLQCPAWWIMLAFALMHGLLSIVFVLTLIISHLCEETEFPLADKDGLLPFNYHQHQLAVSLDYHPTSYLANWIFGGFNAHAAHHLFPRLPHTCYPKLTKIIQRLAKAHGYPYNELPIPKAIGSHYRYLKRVGSRHSR